MTSQPVTPASAASAGADRVGDIDVITRAHRARSLDRHVLRAVKRAAKWLVALMIVSVPVACLVIPTCTLRFQCRTKQAEAKGNLKALYVAEESYRAEFGRYTDDPMAMSFHPKGARLRYEYFVKVNDGRDEPNANAPAFEGYAVANSEDVRGDVWHITHENNVANLVNACPYPY